MLDNTTINVLESAAIEGNAVRLTSGQLDRNVYLAVNEVLTRIGGKWTTKAKAHLFPTDPAPMLAHILATGQLPPKNKDLLAYFPTPAAVARQMVLRADMDDIDLFVLEPSAGTGAICDLIKHVYPSAAIHAVEIDAGRAAVLRAAGYTVDQADFLTHTTHHAYNRILMNPPFTAPGDALAYITHIERAYTMLSPGGRLVAIAPAGFTFRDDKRSRGFRDLVERNGSYAELEQDAFKSSGTGVNTVMLWMDQ
jgi:hypothetical protein